MINLYGDIKELQSWLPDNRWQTNSPVKVLGVYCDLCWRELGYPDLPENLYYLIIHKITTHYENFIRLVGKEKEFCEIRFEEPPQNGWNYLDYLNVLLYMLGTSEKELKKYCMFQALAR